MDQFAPGQRVRVTQQVPQRDEVWTLQTVGAVVRYEQRKTGSWYAHAKANKLWLDRLTLRKDDGELVTCNLDRYSHVEMEEDRSQETEVRRQKSGDRSQETGDRRQEAGGGRQEAEGRNRQPQR